MQAKEILTKKLSRRSFTKINESFILFDGKNIKINTSFVF